MDSTKYARTYRIYIYDVHACTKLYKCTKDVVAWSGRDRCDPPVGYFSSMKAMGGELDTRGICAGTCNGRNDISCCCNSDRLRPLLGAYGDSTAYEAG